MAEFSALNGLEEEIIKELRVDFLEDLKQRIVLINKNIIELEKKGVNKKILKETFRILHNTKGTSGTLGLNEIAVLSHRIEDVISSLLDNEVELSESIVTSILDKTDFLENIRLAYQKNASSDTIHKIMNQSLYNEKTKKLNILIIESSKSIANYLRKNLTEKGHELLDAKSTLDALTRVLTEPIDVLIASKEHPVLDGLNLIRMIKANESKKSIKIILLTSEKIECPSADRVIQKDKKFIENILSFIENKK